MNPKKYRVTLTDDERQHLKAMTTVGKTSAPKVKRAWILLQADAKPEGPGWSDDQIQKAYGVSAVTVYRVRQQFVEEGFEAVLTRRPKSRHRFRRLDGEQEARLIALASVCPETVRQTLKKTR
jgi:hypothetical protein